MSILTVLYPQTCGRVVEKPTTVPMPFLPPLPLDRVHVHVPKVPCGGPVVFGAGVYSTGLATPPNQPRITDAKGTQKIETAPSELEFEATQACYWRKCAVDMLRALLERVLGSHRPKSKDDEGNRKGALEAGARDGGKRKRGGDWD